MIFVIGLVDRFLQEEKVSFENMLLHPPTPTPPTLIEPLDSAVVGTTTPREILPVVVPPHPPSSSFATSSSSITSSSPAQAAAAAANFINPRRNRTQSDEPAINETRQLNLPDNIAEIRDNMRSMIGRRIHRLKTMKQVSTFNEELATAIDSFASNLKSKIERCPSYATLVRKSSNEEGSSSGCGGDGSILSAWNAVISSLEMYARNAEVLSKHIRKDNEELQRSIALSERGGKILQEREEVQWKSLCDAAKIETKAKAKHKQYLLDLEKARARLTSVEEGRGGTGGSSGGGGEDTNVTPRKSTKKIDKHVNKAMGKMFSILPGGGEEVMNKVLTPQQRLAIATRQLDEAEGKEGKGTESYENARFVKEQAIMSYTAEAKAADNKFKSEERSEMNTVQTTLMGSVDGMRNFRDGQLRNITSTMILVKSKLQDRALEDVAGWAVETEKRIRDHLARNVVDETMMGDNDQFDNTGLCLKVQLVKYTDVQETIRHLQSDDDDDGDDEDVSDDMLICDDGEDTAIVNFPSQEIHGGNTCDNNIPASPSPLLSVDIPTDSVIQKMDPIFSKTLTNVSIEEYYLSGWSEEDTPLYGRWLKRKGSFDISVGDWEHSGTEKGFENVWSGETFPLKRVRLSFLLFLWLLMSIINGRLLTIYIPYSHRINSSCSHTRLSGSNSSVQRICTLVLP